MEQVASYTLRIVQETLTVLKSLSWNNVMSQKDS